VATDEPGLHFYLRSGFMICGFDSQYFDNPDPALRTALIVSKNIEAAR
jgi:hypothetical protein